MKNIFKTRILNVMILVIFAISTYQDALFALALPSHITPSNMDWVKASKYAEIPKTQEDIISNMRKIIARGNEIILNGQQGEDLTFSARMVDLLEKYLRGEISDEEKEEFETNQKKFYKVFGELSRLITSENIMNFRNRRAINSAVGMARGGLYALVGVIPKVINPLKLGEFREELGFLNDATRGGDIRRILVVKQKKMRVANATIDRENNLIITYRMLRALNIVKIRYGLDYVRRIIGGLVFHERKEKELISQGKTMEEAHRIVMEMRGQEEFRKFIERIVPEIEEAQDKDIKLKKKLNKNNFIKMKQAVYEVLRKVEKGIHFKTIILTKIGLENIKNIMNDSDVDISLKNMIVQILLKSHIDGALSVVDALQNYRKKPKSIDKGFLMHLENIRKAKFSYEKMRFFETLLSWPKFLEELDIHDLGVLLREIPESVIASGIIIAIVDEYFRRGELGVEALFLDIKENQFLSYMIFDYIKIDFGKLSTEELSGLLTSRERREASAIVTELIRRANSVEDEVAKRVLTEILESDNADENVKREVIRQWNGVDVDKLVKLLLNPRNKVFINTIIDKLIDRAQDGKDKAIDILFGLFRDENIQGEEKRKIKVFLLEKLTIEKICSIWLTGESTEEIEKKLKEAMSRSEVVKTRIINVIGEMSPEQWQNLNWYVKFGVIEMLMLIGRAGEPILERLLGLEKNNNILKHIKLALAIIENDNRYLLANKVEMECPLTRDLMDEPVLASDLWTYEKTAIERYGLESSPMTRQPLDGNLREDLVMKKAIAMATSRLPQARGGAFKLVGVIRKTINPLKFDEFKEELEFLNAAIQDAGIRNIEIVKQRDMRVANATIGDLAEDGSIIAGNSFIITYRMLRALHIAGEVFGKAYRDTIIKSLVFHEVAEKDLISQGKTMQEAHRILIGIDKFKRFIEEILPIIERLQSVYVGIKDREKKYKKIITIIEILNIMSLELKFPVNQNNIIGFIEALRKDKYYYYPINEKNLDTFTQLRKEIKLEEPKIRDIFLYRLIEKRGGFKILAIEELKSLFFAGYLRDLVIEESERRVKENGEQKIKETIELILSFPKNIQKKLIQILQDNRISILEQLIDMIQNLRIDVKLRKEALKVAVMLNDERLANFLLGILSQRAGRMNEFQSKIAQAFVKIRGGLHNLDEEELQIVGWTEDWYFSSKIAEELRRREMKEKTKKQDLEVLSFLMLLADGMVIKVSYNFSGEVIERQIVRPPFKNTDKFRGWFGKMSDMNLAIYRKILEIIIANGDIILQDRRMSIKYSRKIKCAA